MNKPVAWMRSDGVISFANPEGEKWKSEPDWQPLYNHPVKELTLDELKELFAKSNIQTEFSHLIVEFAKAILTKAQEK